MNVEIHKEERVYNGFLKVNEATLTHDRFDGGTVGPIKRLNVERGDAVAAILQDAESGQLILIKQFRYPTHTKGQGWIIETIAGTCEPGALPEDDIKREIEEEAGYAVTELDHISTFFTTPGGSSERIILYYASVQPRDRVSDGGGLISEGEDIQVIRLTLDEAWQMVTDGRIMDAKTVIALQWLKMKNVMSA